MSHYNPISPNQTDISILNMLHTMYTNNSNIVDRLLLSNSEILDIIHRILNNNYDAVVSGRRNNNPPVARFNTSRDTSRDTSTSTSRDTSTSTSTGTNNLSNILFSFPLPNRNTFMLDYVEPINDIEQLLENFLNPVPIRLTQYQFENATTQILFREVFEPRNNSCPITLEPFQENEAVTMIKYCGHLFKTDEINQWFETNVRCPVCRYDLRNYREPTNTINRLLPTEMRSNNIRGNSNSIRRNVNSIRRNVNSTSNSNSALNQLFTSLMETTNTDVSKNYV